MTQVPVQMDEQALDYAGIACCVASRRPLYAMAYIVALERAGRIPRGAYRIHSSEMMRISAERDAEENERGRLRAESGKRPTFVDTDILSVSRQ